MVTITLSFFGQARQWAEQDSTRISVPSQSSTDEVVKEYLKQNNEKNRAFFLNAEGQLHKSILVTLNDEVINSDDKVSLQNNDEITLHPAIAGG